MFYVIYENSEERGVTPIRGSLEDAESYVEKSRKMDKEIGKSYVYYIAKFVKEV